MTTRKQIRDAVIAKIEALPGNSGKVHAFQRKTIDTSGHAIAVYLESGDLTNNVGFLFTEATLVVAVMTPAVTDIDDALDTIADDIGAAIESDSTLGSLVVSCRLSGWSYERDQDDGMTSVLLTYSTRYE